LIYLTGEVIKIGFLKWSYKNVKRMSLVNPDKIIGKFVDLKDKGDNYA